MIKKKAKQIELKLIVLLTTLWLGYSFLFNIMNYKAGVIFSIIYVLIFILVKDEYKYYMILFALPFASIFKINSSLPSVLVGLYILYIGFYLLKNRSIPVIYFIGLIGLSIMQIMSIMIYSAEVINIIAFIINIFFMMSCILNFKSIDELYKKRVFINSSIVFAVSMMLSIVVADILPNIAYTVLREKQAVLMSINRFSGLNGDPNYYSQLILVAIPLIVGIIKYFKNIISKSILVFICSFLIISGLRSRSKSYAITIGVLLVFILIYYLKKIRKSKMNIYIKMLFVILFIILSVVVVYFTTIEIIIPMIKSRTDIGDFFTERSGIWDNYLQIIKMNPSIIITGVGFSNDLIIFSRYFGETKAAHNIYIELVVNIGIVGLSFMMIILKDILKNLRIIFSNISSIYIVMFLITGAGISISSNDVLYILLPIAILLI